MIAVLDLCKDDRGSMIHHIVGQPCFLVVENRVKYLRMIRKVCMIVQSLCCNQEGKSTTVNHPESQGCCAQQ